MNNRTVLFILTLFACAIICSCSGLKTSEKIQSDYLKKISADTIMDDGANRPDITLTKENFTPSTLIDQFDNSLSLENYLSKKSLSDYDIKGKIYFVSCWEDKVVVATTYYQEDISTMRQYIYYLNPETSEAELIEEGDSFKRAINDVTICDNYIYWTDSDATMETAAIDWTLCAYDLESRSKSVICSSGKKYCALPRLTSCYDCVVCQLTSKDGEKEKTEVIKIQNPYDSFEILYDINYRVRSFETIGYSNGWISNTDYFNNHWQIVMYNLKNKEMYSYEISDMDEGDFPVESSANDSYIVYSTFYNKQYVHDIHKENTKLVGTGAYIQALSNDFLAYRTYGGKYIIRRLSTGEVNTLNSSDNGLFICQSIENTLMIYYYDQLGNERLDIINT